MAIKKMYVDLVKLLEDNKDKKVKSILPEIISLVSAKQARNVGSTFLKDSQGNTVGIRCYYFQRWMPIVGDGSVEFGAKKSTATGFNTMSKEGVSNWTKQNNLAKKAHDALLDRLEAGDLTTDQIPAEKARIEEERRIVVESDLMSFAERADLVKHLESQGIELAEYTTNS